MFYFTVGEPVSDLDGMPLEPNKSSKPEPNLAKFTKSKWETVDETELEAQGDIFYIKTSLHKL